MTTTAPLLELFGPAVACASGATQAGLCTARAGLAEHGLALAHTHVRLNAARLHNVARQRLGITDAADDQLYYIAGPCWPQSNAAHRIHCDRRYRLVKERPGLVVHGPLQATDRLELAASRRGARPRVCSSSLGSPPLLRLRIPRETVQADDGLELWVPDARGLTTMGPTAGW